MSLTRTISKTRAGPGALVAYYVFGAAFLWAGWLILKDGAGAGWVFLLIGLGLVLASVYHTLELARYGDTHLKLEGAAWPGGKLKAELRSPGSIAATSLSVTLQCKHVYSGGTPGERSLTEDIIWSHEVDFPLATHQGKSVCRIEFDVPSDAVCSSASENAIGGVGVGHYWEIAVHADVPGVDLLRSYVVQVVAPPARFS